MFCIKVFVLLLCEPLWSVLSSWLSTPGDCLAPPDSEGPCNKRCDESSASGARVNGSQGLEVLKRQSRQAQVCSPDPLQAEAG